MTLSPDDKNVLLKIVRQAIEGKFGKTVHLPPERSETLDVNAGAFVTLKIENELRGCIGYIEPTRPLVATVQDAAVKAAFNDPRFSPLTKEELSRVQIEISLLHPSERIFSPDEITIGLHGLIIDAGFKRGLLLPQVAEEQGWSAEEFLGHTAEKAGLRRDAWRKSGVQIFRFAAEKFSEERNATKTEFRSIRMPAVAGLFYESDRIELQSQVEGLLKRAKTSKVSGELVALIVPHAGYKYSGETAAFAFSLLKGERRKTILLVGPSHHVYFDGISIPKYDAFRTPLGEIPLDVELRQRILNAGKEIRFDNTGHVDEHSLEVQIPFLQQSLPGFQILPIVMGDQSARWCNYLSGVLVKTIDPREVLMVASSDLSHYHSYGDANRMDSHIIAAVRDFDHLLLSEQLGNHSVEACGGGPMTAVMSASKSMGATVSRVLHTCNSGDITGDRERVVGYLSAAFFRISNEIGKS
jgi:hypothetical protein